MMTKNPDQKARVKPFLNDDFLLETETSKALYHDFAKDLPIIDYHCHLPPNEIAENKRFENLTAIWLNGDHYKWRAMRTNGIAEKYITGDAPDWEKFQQWAATVPYTMRNPLYHWSHLELKRYFGIDGILNEKTARDIYDECSSLLQTPEYSTKNLIRKMNVEFICTTDDPTDDLSFHQQLRQEDFEVRVLPAFRPDKVLFIENSEPFLAYIQRLSTSASIEITDLDSLLTALHRRATFFHAQGCRLSDHGLEHLYAADFTDTQVDDILRRALASQEIYPGEAIIYKSAILYYLGELYHELGWTQQFHLGALRNNSSRMLRQLGADTGFDSIGDFPQASALAKFFNRLDDEDKLAKTIVYNLNPAHNEVMATMVGNFNDGSTPGKMQFGSAWWFLDQKDGMEKQMNALSNMGLISRFVGMITDSRSFMSYPRHEYFRRIVCNLFGKDVENGELPNDIDWIGKLVSDICYHNAKRYFEF